MMKYTVFIKTKNDRKAHTAEVIVWMAWYACDIAFMKSLWTNSI